MRQGVTTGRLEMPSKRVYSMKYTMLVKCEKCGYENFPQHRFCGMCATELRIPGPGGVQPATPQPAPSARRIAAPVVPAPKQNVPTTVSGPSFLGLANEPTETRSVSYLLEDEPKPHRRRYLWLILLVGAMAAAGWHWRADLRSMAAKVTTAGEGGPSNSTSSAQAVSGSSPQAAPASGASSGSQVETPNTGVSEQAPVVQTQTPSAAAPSSPVPPPASSSPADSAQSSQVDQSQSGAAASEPAPASETPKVRTKPAAAPAITAADDLEAEGEKYLYGNGVPENCGRARASLLAAAQHSNPKAQNVLGTMYATGHCATRDLPTAYRWFGRSLRKDPGNTRIEQDLKVLWNQMTPEERRLALRDER